MKSGYLTIQSWMREELNLKGNELITYAVIYGFSQDEESNFKGSRQYIADWCGCTVRQVQTILNSLVERNLIVKSEKLVNGVKLCEYHIQRKNFTSGEKTSLGGEKTSLNNIDDNIENNILSKDNILENSEFEGHAYTKDDFLGSVKAKTKVKKKSLYEKCIDENFRYTIYVPLISALEDYLKVRLAMKDKPLYNVNQWIALLNKLSEMTADEKTKMLIVNQSTQHGWASFYDLKNNSSNSNIHYEVSKNKNEEIVDEDY